MLKRVAIAVLIIGGLAPAQDGAKKIEIDKLIELIKPSGRHELAWREIPWMTNVAKARQKAADEGKLLVHWSMTHHPLGSG